jgi:23S rRNA (uracil1939-C5)-methyltransferase
MKRSARPKRRAANSGASEAIATVRIESIAAGGDGVARIEGMACFVPRTAPGDVVQIAYTKRARFARGRLLQVVEPSPNRTEPRCQHFVRDRCGGCRMQHVQIEAQHETVRRIVRDAIARVGHREIDLPDLTSGAQWEYRERLTLTLRQRGNGWDGGLHAYDNPSRIFSLHECPVSHPLLLETWRAIRGKLRGLPLPVSVERPLRLSLRLSGEWRDRVAVVVLGGSEWGDGSAWATQLMSGIPALHSVWWIGDGQRPVRLGGTLPAEANAADGERDGEAEPASDDVAFAQINSAMAAVLRDYVLGVTAIPGVRSVVDAYAGRGEVAAVLASRGIVATAIETDPSATHRAEELLAPFPDARVVTAPVEAVLEEALPADVVLVNPPRRGLDERVTLTLADAMDRGVQRIVYVSCDPATLARDVSRLPRWRITSVRCFDMFPQTAHVETVVVLIPEES